MPDVHQIYDFASFPLPWSVLCFPPAWSLFLGFLLLILSLGSRILILIACPSDQCTSERARTVKITWR